MQPSKRSLSTIVSAVLATGLLLGPAGAVEFASRTARWTPPENPACTCRFKGEHVPLGTLRCLQTPNGPRTAECVTEQNVTSWRPGQAPCPQAGLFTPRPS